MGKREKGDCQVTTRRDFIVLGAAAAATAFGQEVNARKVKTRAVLLHLGQNMWGGYLAPGERKMPGLRYTADHLRTDETVWRSLTDLMAARKYNMAVIDVGEGLVYPSHPELAVKGSWSAEKLAAEVKRLKTMGIEAIPKLNFSACHDGWLKMYGRMLSTDKYRAVVKDLIDDVCKVFGNPRYFHLGLDEEDAEMQRRDPFVVIRRGDAWWKDFYHYLDCLSAHGARAIVFPGEDARESPEIFRKRMPKEVIQNPWMYGHGHDYKQLLEWGKKRPYRLKQAKTMEMFKRFGEDGYMVLACASNWVNKSKMPKPWPTGKDYPQDPEAIAWFWDHMSKAVPDTLLMGAMVAPWGEIKPELEHYWKCGINQLADVFDSQGC